MFEYIRPGPHRISRDSKLPTTLKRIISSVTCALALATLPSCVGGPNTQMGTAIGGLGGAAVGGIIGNQSGRGLEGAAIGAGLGALGGALIGNAQDQRYGWYSPRQRYYRGY